jgi:hypothetical protein
MRTGHKMRSFNDLCRMGYRWYTVWYECFSGVEVEDIFAKSEAMARKMFAEQWAEVHGSTPYSEIKVRMRM